ncbi:hypothetical protein ACFWDI_21065 [Streptomyces sp. NPDC060064]|uniref:helix-turn-helix domain-containing protein n=1 Tax=Streptomyces sp. NPDC060064 TaxID=3347049 RepID=UPI0036B2AEAF
MKASRRVDAPGVWASVGGHGRHLAVAGVHSRPRLRRAGDGARLFGRRGRAQRLLDGYFASRAAALGAVSPDVVTAAFYNFAPARVACALPDAWHRCAPEAVLAARLEVADQARLRERGVLAEDGSLTDAGHLERHAIEATTDRLARPVLARARLADCLRPLARRIVEAGGVPFPNAMGLPPLRPG